MYTSAINVYFLTRDTQIKLLNNYSYKNFMSHCIIIDLSISIVVISVQLICCLLFLSASSQKVQIILRINWRMTHWIKIKNEMKIKIKNKNKMYTSQMITERKEKKRFKIRKLQRTLICKWRTLLKNTEKALKLSFSSFFDFRSLLDSFFFFDFFQKFLLFSLYFPLWPFLLSFHVYIIVYYTKLFSAPSYFCWSQMITVFKKN